MRNYTLQKKRQNIKKTANIYKIQKYVSRYTNVLEFIIKNISFSKSYFCGGKRLKISEKLGLL